MSETVEPVGGTEAFRREFAKESRRYSFGAAPEVQEQPAEPKPLDPKVAASIAADVAEIADQAAAARLEAEESRDELADAWYTGSVAALDQMSPIEALQAAEKLTEVAGVGDYRTQDYLAEWSARDPAGAGVFLDAQASRVRSELIAAETAEARADVQAAQARAAAALDKAWGSFMESHGRQLAESPTLDDALSLVISASVETDPASVNPERVATTLAESYRRAKELVRAHDSALHEWQTRQAFSDEQRRRAIRNGEVVPAPPAPPTLEDIVNRMPVQADARQVRHAQEVAGFREAFANEARGRSAEWADGNRKAAAAAQRAQAAAKAADDIRRGRR